MRVEVVVAINRNNFGPTELAVGLAIGSKVNLSIREESDSPRGGVWNYGRILTLDDCPVTVRTEYRELSPEAESLMRRLPPYGSRLLLTRSDFDAANELDLLGLIFTHLDGVYARHAGITSRGVALLGNSETAPMEQHDESAS